MEPRSLDPVACEAIDEEQQKRGQELDERLDHLLHQTSNVDSSSMSHGNSLSRVPASKNFVNSPSPAMYDMHLRNPKPPAKDGVESQDHQNTSQQNPLGNAPGNSNKENYQHTKQNEMVTTTPSNRSPQEADGLHGTAKSIKNQRDIDFTAPFVQKKKAKATKADEEAAARKKAEEEAAARKKSEEEAARKKAEEEAACKKAEEEAARKKAEEEAARKKAEEEAARKKAEEKAAARRKAEEEAAARKKAEEKAARKKAGKEAAACKEAEANSRGGASCPTPDDGRHGTVKSLKNHREINFAVSFVEKKKRKR